MQKKNYNNKVSHRKYVCTVKALPFFISTEGEGYKKNAHLEQKKNLKLY